MSGHREKTAVCTPRRGAWGEGSPADSVTSDSEPPDCETHVSVPYVTRSVVLHRSSPRTPTQCPSLPHPHPTYGH